ncbi:MAG: PEP-CTERM sorting domain-containing protein [Phycisphaerae bacterium]|nr:PEP-CTERM sorting domain-containing protein [Phycisphaerae bacterium]
MRPSRILGSGCLCCALTLVLVLTLTVGTAQGTMINGSIAISANWATQDQATLASSTIFTPYAITGFTTGLTFGPNALTMIGAGGGGSGDFAALPFTLISTAPAPSPPGVPAPLDINNGTAWAFTSANGDWTTSTFLNIDPAATNGYLDFLLTGTFTPKGALAGFDPTPAEMRISLNQTGSTVNWTSTMNMIPEPMTASLLAIGGFALLRRRRRK